MERQLKKRYNLAISLTNYVSSLLIFPSYFYNFIRLSDYNEFFKVVKKSLHTQIFYLLYLLISTFRKYRNIRGN